MCKNGDIIKCQELSSRSTPKALVMRNTAIKISSFKLCSSRRRDQYVIVAMESLANGLGSHKFSVNFAIKAYVIANFLPDFAYSALHASVFTTDSTIFLAVPREELP